MIVELIKLSLIGKIFSIFQFYLPKLDLTNMKIFLCGKKNAPCVNQQNSNNIMTYRCKVRLLYLELL